MKFFILLIFAFINSCASLNSSSKDVPVYIAQEGEKFYIHLVLDHIPTYSFYIDEILISADDIKYQKTDFGHLIKVPVIENQKDFKVKSALNTYIHRKIHFKENPKKLMVFASFSKPLFKAIKKEDPDVLVVFAPPSTQYYTSKDFFKSPLFFQKEVRLIHVIGHEHFRKYLNFSEFSLSDLEDIEYMDRPTLLTHYLPFTFPRENFSFNQLGEQLKRKELPVIFLSSYPHNIIQQIPKNQIGLPAYEFSVKNHFLTLNSEDTSPWEMITDQRADYFTLQMKFINSYWHVHLRAKDVNLEQVFERDLTLYQSKLHDGRNRRRAR